MADAEIERVAIFSINPEYAKPIMDGSKKVEFRRNAVDSNLRYIIVYATAPIKKILGFFEISGIEIATPSELWRKHKKHGGIKYADFRRYYIGKKAGVAIGVGALHLLENPVGLSTLDGEINAPQSFCYVDRHLLDKLSTMCR